MNRNITICRDSKVGYKVGRIAYSSSVYHSTSFSIMLKGHILNLECI